MIETPSYADALRILGCKDGRLAKVIGFAAAAERSGWPLAGAGQLVMGVPRHSSSPAPEPSARTCSRPWPGSPARPRA
ncbi:hypothetical protein, partial [Nonomuraea wenchangensis]|uniref:hypothetical protein n=1 Tax=Nonomuraea wenchangensis TaxID=568860 RepID=UPI00331B608B